MTCLKMHQNDFQHFEPGIPELADYDLGIKIHYNQIPPPPGSRSEPRLYLYVSVLEPKAQQTCGTVHYARSRTFLTDKPAGGKGDKDRLKSDVLLRLASDVKALLAGTRTSDEEPIFVQSVS